jgi:hypothetical protein
VSSDGASVYIAEGTKEVLGQFSRDGTTGALTAMSPASVPAGKHSYSIAVSPDGQSAYVTNESGENISQYSRATLASAPTVVTGAASAVGRASATLNATVTPNGNAVSNCKLEYGTSTSYESSAPCSPEGSGWSPVAVSATVVTLNAGTTYHYRVVATNSNGTREGADQTFTTLPNPPIAVTGLASPVGQTTATMNASVNPSGGAVSECKLEYGTSTTYESSAPCVPSPGSGSSAVSVSASVSGLSANTTYHFTVVAKNAGGPATGKDQRFTTLPSPPTVVTQVASVVAQTSAMLNATVNPNGGEVSECELEYGTTSSYGSSAACISPPGSGSSAVAVSALAGELTANTTYHFRVLATNTGGSSVGKDQRFTTLPKPPAVVTESAVPPPVAAVLPVPNVKLVSTSIVVSASGVVVVKVTCPAGGSPCTGTLMLRTLNAVSASAASQSAKPKAIILTLATVSYNVPAGQVKTLRLRLSARARNLLSRTRVLKVRATIVAHDTAGAAAHTNQIRITLRAPKIIIRKA